MVLRRFHSGLRAFLEQEAAGGYVLMAAAALAVIVANSPLAGLYTAVLEQPLPVPHGPLHLPSTPRLWIDDGLMALFFLLVGLEIKREVGGGHLAGRALVLPAGAALAGVALPALLYIALTTGQPGAARGWAIPAATDIAFALGVLGLARSVPTSLKLFLMALAILDDLAAILIIALFYTADLHLAHLAGAAVLLLGLGLLNRLKVKALWPYLTGGLILWLLVLQSGVHATLAGVALAMVIPPSASHRLEGTLQTPVAFGVTPLFGFANAGLALTGLGAILSPIPLGVGLGLFLGKQAGVFLGALLLVRLRLADKPAGASWAQVYGVAALCGIGFTMSLFVGNLAFADPAMLEQVKLGVFAGSLASAALGLTVLSTSRRRAAPLHRPG